MQVDEACRRDVITRLRRVEGQVAGIIAMVEAGRDCTELLTQFAAASKALDRAGLKVISSGMQQCAAAIERGEEPPIEPGKLEKLFLSLA